MVRHTGHANRRSHRTTQILWVALLALCAFPALALAATPGVVDRLSFLHVGSSGGAGGLAQILDTQDRSTLLRGVNLNGLEDYYSNSSTPTAVAYPTDPGAYANGRCPVRNHAVESMAVCDFDAVQMRGFGYDAVRLAVSWSLLEPTPGHIDQTYIDRIAQVVGWLRSQGIYSVIDMHQDAWSKYLYTAPGGSCPPPLSPVTGAHESDGAPQWASSHISAVCQAGAREIDAAVQEDFQRFWSNTPGPDGVGLQDHFASVVRALAQRFAGDPAVAGYDILNEPSPGVVPPPGMDASELFPFYAKVIQTVRTGVPGFRQLFFIEPDVTRDVTDQRYAFSPWSTYSSYRGVVYAPHIYTHVFTPDAEAHAPGLGPLYPVSSGYTSAAADARSLGLPLWDGEFGTDVATDETTLRQHYDSQDQLAVGGALWVWKADGTAQAGGFSAMQGPFGMGQPFPSRVKFSDRAYPIYTAGSVQGLGYDPDGTSLDLRATSSPVSAGDRAHATLIYVPAASRGQLRATGATLEVSELGDGAREAYVYPSGGAYHVFQGPADVGPGLAVGPVYGSSQHGVTLGRLRCFSRRRLTLHLRASGRGRILGARAYVGRRLVGRMRARRPIVPISLRGLPRQLVRVRIIERVRTAVGVRHVVVVRRYRTCTARRHGHTVHIRR